MSSPSPRLWLATLFLLLVMPLEFMGCAPEDAGTINLKKKADLLPSGASKPREFRNGDLEER